MIQIINLPNRTDRRKQVMKEILRVAGDGFPSKASFFSAMQPEDPLGFPSASMRGNLISHREAIRKAADENKESVLILEDDVIFRKNWTKASDAVIRDLDSINWKISYLGHLSTDPVTNNGFFSPCNAIELAGAHCYALKRDVYGPFLHFLDALEHRLDGDPEGGPMFFDGALNFFRLKNEDIPAIYATPSLAIQRPSRTDCHPNALYDRVPIIRSAVQLLRDIKFKNLRA